MDKKRISGIDLVRFLCAIGILVHHFMFFFWYDKAELGTQPRLRSGYVIVEIFLIIAGYFAAKHFKNQKNKPSDDSLESRAKTAVKYTFKKFKSFMPYIIIAVLLGLVYSLIKYGFSLDNLVAQLEDIPQELLLDSGNISWFGRAGHVAPLWYLSLLFFVFPIFCTLSMSKKPFARNWIYFVFAFLYYSQIFNGSYDGFEGMIRIFTGLALGQLLFDFVEYIKDKQIQKRTRILLQIAELFCVYYIIEKLLVRGDVFRPVEDSPYLFNFILCAWTGLALMLSEKTYSHKINSSFISFLGKIALPLYLFHTQIGFIIHYFTDGKMDFKWELALSASISIIFSIGVYLIISNRQKARITS